MSEVAKNRPYRYFDTPDGEDVGKKLWYVFKPSFVGALFLSAGDVLTHSRPKGYGAILGRFAYISLPLIGMGAAFVITTNMSANIRNKDDEINWAAGGIAAGSIFGAWRKSTPAGAAACALLGAAAVLKKHAVDNNFTLFPKKKHTRFGNHRSVNNDFTFMADPKDAIKQ